MRVGELTAESATKYLADLADLLHDAGICGQKMPSASRSPLGNPWHEVDGRTNRRGSMLCPRVCCGVPLRVTIRKNKEVSALRASLPEIMGVIPLSYRDVR